MESLADRLRRRRVEASKKELEKPPSYLEQLIVKQEEQRRKRVRERSARDKVRRKEATPIDQTPEEKAAIEALYDKCPIGFTLDHIVPINGCRDCGEKGTHTLKNLQYLPVIDNCVYKQDLCNDCWRKRDERVQVLRERVASF